MPKGESLPTLALLVVGIHRRVARARWAREEDHRLLMLLFQDKVPPILDGRARAPLYAHCRLLADSE